MTGEIPPQVNMFIGELNDTRTAEEALRSCAIPAATNRRFRKKTSHNLALLLDPLCH